VANSQTPNSTGEEKTSQSTGARSSQSQPLLPAVSLPKGGGAIKGIGEKFAANPVTGTSSLTVTIPISPGRSSFGPQLTLSYDSGAGNGPFGFGWSLAIPKITRKTDKGIPRYRDDEESDVFILSETEDLVPVLLPNGEREILERSCDGKSYRVLRYRPRIEGLFARIERWGEREGEAHWRVTTKENVTSIYGDSSSSCIADPDDPRHVFSWLLSRTYDDKGNLVVYEYKSEDAANVRNDLHEHKRKISANRYLKRISYCHQTPYFPADNASLPTDWHFQVVFDYGEHDLITPSVEEDLKWMARPDSFSTYRSGFEIRTYRRCRRVLMFHSFAELGDTPCLVRSTDISFLENGSNEPEQSLIASFIAAVTQSGYIRRNGEYLKQSYPPVEFDYTKAVIDQTVHIADSLVLENLPEGIDGSRYQWVDIDGEGTSGVLTKLPGAWLYRRNLTPLSVAGESGLKLGPTEVLKLQPALSSPAPNAQQLLDLAGDGQLDVVQFGGAAPGFNERTDDGSWEPFTTFTSSPNIPWGDANLKFIDLSGDGHADILISEDEAFTWYRSLGQEGFGAAESVRKAANEEDGPRLVFADGTQSVYLADMSGDGLNDFVRVRNGEVCYWPNLGYGRFGAKVTMSSAPLFDYPNLFDQDRIRLADIDGSGVTDIIYLGRDLIRVFFNRSGNSWSPAVALDQMPLVDNLDSVTAMDLLGNGTACLVWSSPGPSHANEAMRYVDLMGGTKPHLLTGVKNNLGAETRVQYAPSTKFYLQDLYDGKPWITRLPFPVHVIEQVELFDWISKTKVVTRYKYHHGYFDGPEREFRGFGKVEQWDTESFSKYTGAGLFTELPQTAGEDFHLPPVRTVSWFHNGAFIDQERISRQYIDEYYKGDPEAQMLSDTTLPDELSAQDAREACRALKGRLLRQEIYAEDGSEKTIHPYFVTEQAYKLKVLQGKRNNSHAVFYGYECENLKYIYERDPSDPRVTHQLTTQVDEFGNIEKSATVAYPRRPHSERRPEQARSYISYTESRFLNAQEEELWYRVGIPVETRTYELTGIPLAGILFTAESIATAAGSAIEIPYEVRAEDTAVSKRLIDQIRTLYRRNDLSEALSLGKVESLALPFETYTLVFTPSLLNHIYNDRVTEAMLKEEGGYVQLDDINWWLPTGKIFYSELDNPAQELTHARSRFFLAHRQCDAFGNYSTVTYDQHNLLPTLMRDPLGNEYRCLNDYRVLQPQLVIDPNQNQAAVAFNALGLVVGTATMGKLSETRGDSLTDFVPDLTSEQLDQFFANPRGPLAAELLANASSRIIYDPERFQRDADIRKPVYSATISRETHVSDLAEPSKLQVSITFADGFGREIERKHQAEPGLAPVRGPMGQLLTSSDGKPNLVLTNSRWVVAGRKVFDNKGNVTKSYEPFFDSTHHFVFEKELAQFGVTPILTYDPLGRLIRTEIPDGSFGVATFNAWTEQNFDANDTVDESTWLRERESLPATPENFATRRAAQLTKEHANTPTTRHLDPLGRAFLLVHNNGNGGTPETRFEIDIEANQLSVTDALGRKIMSSEYSISGFWAHQNSADSGERWRLEDATGELIYRWDSRKQRFRTRYDPLRRPTHVMLASTAPTEILLERNVYGEAHPDSDSGCRLNLRGRVFLNIDQGGISVSGQINEDDAESYDFKGNLINRTRRFSIEYKNPIDWSFLDSLLNVDGIPFSIESMSRALETRLEPESFVQRTDFDALNRVIKITSPDQSVITPKYNEASQLKSVTALLRGSTGEISIFEGLSYNAKGQREEILYGNGISTNKTYDPRTFRLAQVVTRRGALRLQDLQYVYDAVGNILTISDRAQQTTYFSNEVVTADCHYAYDALYRVTHAEGREHTGNSITSQVEDDDGPRLNRTVPDDGQLMSRYSEDYVYDSAGNILAMIHHANQGSWTRRYAYSTGNNRLLSTSVPGESASGPFSARYDYDEHGNMVRMPHLPSMRWNAKDELASTQRQVVNSGFAETTYYVYDSFGERIRKVTERQAHEGSTPSRKNERLYLWDFEVYREYAAGNTNVSLERQTLHIKEGKQLIATFDRKTVDANGTIPVTETIARYELGNHLGSAMLELDSQGAIISYEEFYPYGSTSYQATSSSVEVDTKRYRFAGQERDEESALYHQGARYYIPWLGRWTSCDPAEIAPQSKPSNSPASKRKRTSSPDSPGIIPSYPNAQGNARSLARDEPNEHSDSMFNRAPQEASAKFNEDEASRWNLYLALRANPIAFIDSDGRAPEFWYRIVFTLWSLLVGPFQNADHKPLGPRTPPITQEGEEKDPNGPRKGGGRDKGKGGKGGKGGDGGDGGDDEEDEVEEKQEKKDSQRSPLNAPVQGDIFDLLGALGEAGGMLLNAGTTLHDTGKALVPLGRAGYDMTVQAQAEVQDFVHDNSGKLGWGALILGCTVGIATLAEDVVTFGPGIADDPPTLGAAAALITGGLKLITN
jgi:RHS repeat-associated protein